MNRRRTEGDETWLRLRVWTRGQKAGERLAAHVLRTEEYSAVDPSHPLGGPDSLKDAICSKNGQTWIGAAYFARTQKQFNQITRKFTADLKGVKTNKVGGIVFITNQELTLSQRGRLNAIAEAANTKLDLFHLERVARLLDMPESYGTRLEFLDIEMTKEEQVAFFAAQHAGIERLQLQLERVLIQLENSKTIGDVPLYEIQEFKRILDSISGSGPLATLMGGGHTNALRVPLSELQQFKLILDSISGSGPLATLMGGGHTAALRVPLWELQEFKRVLDSISGSGYLTGIMGGGHTNALRVPLWELQEFKRVLDSISGSGHLTTLMGGGHTNALRVPLSELREFESALKRIVGGGETLVGPIRDLQVPLPDIREYEETLDRITAKLAKVEKLKAGEGQE